MLLVIFLFFYRAGSITLYRHGNLWLHLPESLCPLEELAMYIFSPTTPIVSWRESLLGGIKIL
jgi:hypothetical protein